MPLFKAVPTVVLVIVGDFAVSIIPVVYPALIAAATAYRDYLTGETLAVELELTPGAPDSAEAMSYSEQAEIDGLPLSIALRRC